jgi:hypothetical protein
MLPIDARRVADLIRLIVNDALGGKKHAAPIEVANQCPFFGRRATAASYFERIARKYA